MIILAGGYAKRMWPLTKNIPKPLLPVQGKPIIEHIIDNIRESGVRDVIISTNEQFRQQFQSWLTQNKNENIRIFAEKSSSEENKLGAIRALTELLKALPPDDYLVLAGDNIITSNLAPMISFYNRINKPIVGLFEPVDKKQLQAGSVVVIDRNKQIKKFIEKPKRSTKGKLGALAYILPYRTLVNLDQYLAEGNDPDDPGRFIAWLHKREPVYGYPFTSHVLDIGNLQLFAEANKIRRRSVTRGK
ncbi:MAG TPA: nucleotidyltransferase family protein [Candidatus Bathyarchaeia archaeon]|nr:nucleotidyltransferase family protein [Candidatus Bathyarchaeia archaeon]